MGGWSALRLGPFPSSAQTEPCLLPTATLLPQVKLHPAAPPGNALGSSTTYLCRLPTSCSSLGSHLKLCLPGGVGKEGVPEIKI